MIPDWLSISSFVSILVDHQRDQREPLATIDGIVISHYDHPGNQPSILVQTLSGQHWFVCTEDGLWVSTAQVSSWQGDRLARILTPEQKRNADMDRAAAGW